MEEEKPKHPYKIMIGDTITIFRTDYQGRTYYNAKIYQKMYDGEIKEFYRPINFRKGIELSNLDEIKIIDMYENLRENKKDPYNPITCLFINEFIEIKNQKQKTNEALNEYQDILNNQEEELPF